MEIFSQNETCQEVIRIENLKKKYRLGVIGSGTLQGDIQSLIAKIRKQDDPNRRIGQKVYENPEDFWALNGIDLSIYKGETLGLIGGNGAGKSTLLKILSRVTAPTEGQIYVKGRIASMLEVGTGFHRELTGRENVYLNGAIMGMKPKEVDERLQEIIEFAEIEKFIDTPVKRYSSGMYVKLAFSVAAHLNADILLMDEVLAVGDAKFQKKCVDKMQQLASEEGKTVIFVSHNMNTISSMCSRCAVLKNGQLEFVGETGKAIELYYKHYDGENAVFYRLDEMERPKNYPFSMRMESLYFPEKDTAEFAAEEGIRGILRWRSTTEESEVCLRMTLRYNGAPIGTCISRNIEGTIRPDTVYETEFAVDTQELAPGTYTASMGLYRHTAEGLHTPLDYVETAFSFRITEGKLENKVWKHRFWGSVIWKEADILSHTEIKDAGQKE